MKPTFLLVACIALSGCGAIAAPSTSTRANESSATRAGSVAFSEDEVTWQGGNRTDREGVGEVIVQLLESWCALDSASYREPLAPNVTRINRVSGISRGIDEVLASLPREWEEMERPGGRVAVDLVVENARIEIEKNIAFATYTVAVEGKKEIRWEFSDRWLISQIFTRNDEGRWLLLHQSLASDLDAEGEDPAFDFAFALPVTDLERAVAFYTPLVGEPEHVGTEQASFRVGAVRFLLDAGVLEGFARVRSEKPNGYVLFTGLDLPDETDEEENLEPVKSFETPEKDKAAVYLDPAGNPFVLLDEISALSGPAPKTIFPRELPTTAARALGAWMREEAGAFAAEFAPAGTWFENTRSDLEIVATGREEIRRRAESQFKNFDRSPKGLAARLTIRDLVVSSAGKHQILSFQTVLEGLGVHKFRDEAFVTMVLREEKIQSLFSVRRLPEALVREFDYVGYPTEGRKGPAGLNAVERFYRERLDLGKPYTDDAWFGFWSAHAVFGLFEAERAIEGFPEPRTANGYPSFWVASAGKTEEYLRAQGCKFPVYPSINARAGVDKKSGYSDLLATDPDGNLILFTEYSGK